MAEFDKILMDEAAGQELAKQAKKYVDDNTVTPSALATTLADYDKSTEVDSKIDAKIAASEKKIFGDGQLAEAFDTIKEIGDYLENHDDVAAGLTAEIGKKVDKDTYASDKSTIEGNISQNASDIADLKEALGLEGEGDGESVSDRLDNAESDIEDLQNDKLDKTEAAATYVKIEDVQVVSVATVQGWFN